jgi:Reverse transcriptase (RNA-dependent DNA polymerase)/Integrase core domain
MANNTDTDKHARPRLPPGEILTGQANWETFRLAIPFLFDEYNLWDWDKKQPTEACKANALLSNIAVELRAKFQSPGEKITAIAVWKQLGIDNSSKSTHAKLASLSELFRYKLLISGGTIDASFLEHARLRRGLISAWGTTIDADELANTLFLYSLPAAFDAIRAVEQGKKELEFDSLQGAIRDEVLHDSTILQKSKPVANNVTTGDANKRQGAAKGKPASDKPCEHYKDGSKCFRCHPCRLCVAAKLDKTFHFEGGDRCASVSHANQVVVFTADSGCSDHMVSDNTIVQLYPSTLSSPISILLADGSSLSTKGRGDVFIEIPQGKAKLGQTILCPELTSNLLSIPKLDDNGFATVFFNQSMVVLPSIQITDLLASLADQIIMRGKKVGKLYQVKLEVTDGSVPNDSALALLASVPKRSLNDWHLAFNHLNVTDLKRLPNMVAGLVPSNNTACDCVACLVGKSTVQPFPTSTRIVTRPGELISSDWWGPVASASHDGCQYFLSFVDHFSSKSWVYPFTSPAEIVQLTKDFLMMVKNFTNRHVTTLRMDRGPSFTSGGLKDFMRANGIHAEFANVDTPQQNGKAERLNRTLLDDVRCMLAHSGLPVEYWEEALRNANYTRNFSPAAKKTVVPNEGWTGVKPNVSHLKVFGSVCYPHIPKSVQISKLLPRASSALFVGYDEETKSYRCIDPSTSRLVLSSSVRFPTVQVWPRYVRSRFAEEQVDRRIAPEGEEYHPVDDDDHGTDSDNDDSTNDDASFYSVDDDVPAAIDDDVEILPRADDVVVDVEIPDPGVPDHIVEVVRLPLPGSEGGGASRQPTGMRLLPPSPRRLDISPTNIIGPSEAGRRTRSSGATALLSTSKVLLATDPPCHWGDVRGRSDSEEWYAAAEKEWAGLLSRDFGTLVVRPPSAQVLGSRWVFTRKASGDGKARWVIRGDQQKVDPVSESQMTYAPVAENASFKVLCGIVASENLLFDQIDVTQAFLLADIEGDVYVHQPAGFVVRGKEKLVYKLNRSVYGLREAPRLWNQELDKFLRSQGLKPSSVDPCIYFKSTPKGKLYLLCHVDDMPIAATDRGELDQLKTALHKKFGIKDLGAVGRFTSYQVERDENTLTLFQHDYVAEVLDMARMSDCTPTKSPGEHFKLLSSAGCPTTVEDSKFMSTVPYRSIIGALLHLSTRTRPDIAQYVSILTRYSANPGRSHWEAAKSLLRYLKGTSRAGLVYRRGASLTLIGYADSDFANEEKCRSTTGYCFFLGGACVSWKSKLQTTVTTSSTEAETVALYQTASESIWLRYLLSDLGYSQSAPTTLYADNQGAIRYCHTKESHSRMKHINIDVHFTREKINDGSISVIYVPSAANVADGLTKPLKTTPFMTFFDRLGLFNFSK